MNYKLWIMNWGKGGHRIVHVLELNKGKVYALAFIEEE